MLILSENITLITYHSKLISRITLNLRMGLVSDNSNLKTLLTKRYMTEKKMHSKPNSHNISSELMLPFNDNLLHPHTPIKKGSTENQSFLSPLPFPPKHEANHEGQLQSFFDELRIVQTPLVKQHSKLLPYPEEDGIAIGIGGRIIFESQGQYRNNNSSEMESQENSESEQRDQPQRNSSQDGESESFGEEENMQDQGNGQETNLGKNSEGKARRVFKPKGNVNLIKDSNPNKKVFCNCKKTKCLKLYCDCFRLNQTCEGCNCTGCHNLQIYSQERNNAILALMDRNPDPFGQKIEDDKHVKGCNCKKSNCLKKYCECYQANLRCGDNCKCEQCKNTIAEKEAEEAEKSNSKNTAKKQRKMVEI